MRYFSFFLNNKNGGGFITFAYRHRKQIIIGVICFVVLISVVCLILFYCFKTDVFEKDKNDDLVLEDKIDKKDNNTDNKYYKVDIKGEIVNPGIYELKIDSRVIDVINAAGGLTENADTSVINLSKKINDEMVIIIYSREQVKDFEKTKEIEKQVLDKCSELDENSLKNDACIDSSNNKHTGKVNINTASLEELMTLTGIGEAKAKDIIKYREENGGFKTIDDLLKVSGIGDNTFASIKENITV